MAKATKTPILPKLVEAVNTSGELHYREATQLIQQDVWGRKLPKTPQNTVMATLTTATGPDGKKLFRRTSPGVYRILGGKTAYKRYMKSLSA